ncbi:hypothetical protein ACROYT_G001856 [Oculina patagonica]
MSGVSADVLGQIILKIYDNFPQFFTGNYTLAEVLSTVRYNATVLSFIANTTGLGENVIQQTVDVYLIVAGYMKPTTAAPTSNTTITNTTGDDSCKLVAGLLTFSSVFIALIIVLVLSFLNQRKRLVRLWGKTITRPGLCIPVNLVDSYENRFAFACAFGATTTKCINIMFFGDYRQIFPDEMIAWIERPEGPSFTAIIWKIVAMMVIGIAYYPLFACMATDFKITGLVIGFLYSALWINFLAEEYIQCPVYSSLVFPGDGLVAEFPVLICLVFLCLRYFVLLVKAIHARRRLYVSPKVS